MSSASTKSNQGHTTKHSVHSRTYAIHSDEECERLDQQAHLARIEGHLRHLPVPQGAKVLDAGCGSGSMARLIAQTHRHAEVIGVDVRQKYLDYAATNGHQQGLENLSFKQGDIFALPFADASFDVVWTKYVLQWLKEPKQALAELKRVTKPGGLVVSCDFDGFVTEHFPVTSEFDRQVRTVMASIVDTNTGRKVAPYMMSLGFDDVGVEIETDHVFTVVGAVDHDRRRNWEIQWRAARSQLIEIIGSPEGADRFVTDFLSHHDDARTCTFTSLYFTHGRAPAPA